MKRVAIIFGTRPEAIKLAPVIKVFKESKQFLVDVINTGQHREMTNQVLKVFKIKPDFNLRLMKDNQTLTELCQRAIEALGIYIEHNKPDYVLVQGDTTTAFCGALVAFYNKIPVGHVEAGLRTYSTDPYPEEAHRRMIAQIATHHFAPTTVASERLSKEHILGEIVVTGNTVVDAMRLVRPATIKQTGKDIVLVTVHRRENFPNIETICDEVKKLANSLPVQVVFPVHPNPNVRQIVYDKLDNNQRISLMDPLTYTDLLKVLDIAKLVVTDSGGLQEEAPSYGKPVLILRESTERSEGVQAGVAVVTGPEFFETAYRLLTSPEEYTKMAHTTNPYGDGHASERIFEHVRDFLKGGA